MQVLADPAGRLIWVSPPLPGSRHDLGAAREHGILEAIDTTQITVLTDTAYQDGQAGQVVGVEQHG